MYNAEFDLGNLFDFHFGAVGRSFVRHSTITKRKKNSRWIAKQCFGKLPGVKHFQAELGINSNLNAQKSFTGIFFGVKLTGIRIK